MHLATQASTCTLQLEDLNRGTFGFVQLAYDRATRQQVAIKFIERGDKVRTSALALPGGLLSAPRLAVPARR